MVDRTALTNWLRKQFAADRPWNEVVYDLVTATGSNKENGAVNFTLAHLEFGAVPLTSRTTRLFLGQQIQCTQCHDHPSNDWKQGDFWGINAFFQGIGPRTSPQGQRHRRRGLRPHRADATSRPTLTSAFDKRNGMVGIAFPRFLDGRKISQGTDVDPPRRAGQADRRLQERTTWRRAFVNRMWGHFLGRGFVNPVDDFGAAQPAQPSRAARQAGRRTSRPAATTSRQLIRWIMASRAYKFTSVTAEGEARRTRGCSATCRSGR